jgi:sensor histidine kinase YesM
MSRIGKHIIFWTAYVLFKTYLNVSIDPDMPLNYYGLLILVQMVYLLVKVPLVYFCFFVIDQYLTSRWNLWNLLITLLAGFTLATLGMSFLNHTIALPMLGKIPAASVVAVPSLLYHIFTLFFVVGVASSIRLFRRQYKSRLREIELQKEKKETELKYLKGQINPHFLFNTLNNIYSLARKGSGQTAEAIMRLSKLMRFMLYDAGNQTILLLDELKLIKDYIELEKLRYTHRLVVTYEESIDDPDQRIAPLILIHFVENAFKHGVSESRFDSCISVNVALTNKMLTASFENSKEEGVSLVNESKTIGMNNIKRQLELIYPDHQLKLLSSPDKYKVDLTIPLTDHD